MLGLLVDNLCMGGEAAGDLDLDFLVLVVVFFFQAEDGIRDLIVTGVQTCALPISRTAVGEFSLEQAITLEELAEAKLARKFADYLIPLENLLANFPRVNVLPVIEKRVRHGTKFNITLAQLQPGRVEPPPGATTQLDGGEPKPPRLRVFSQQDKLIAIAEAVVPRTYQPIVVFEALP